MIETLPANLARADPEQLRLAARQRLYQLDLELCWREQFKIQTKDMRLLPLIPNPVQAPLLAAMKKQHEKTGKIRQIWFKCRQPGASTIASAVVAHKTYLFPNVYSFVVAQDKTTVERIFGMHTIFHENMSPDIRPNKQYHVKGTEIALGNPDTYTRDEHPGLRSRILVGEAKNINVGTGFTIHVIHLSEVCRYPYVAPLTESLIPALSDSPGTIRIFESTAHYAPGGAFFKDQCERAMRGETEYEYHFLEWWKMPEYSLPHVKREMRLSIEEKFLIKKYGLTIGNIKWRRQKISDYNGDEDAFRQNYPMTFEEAWITRESSTFPRDAMMELRSEIKPPLKSFGIEGGRMYELPDGDFKVWETPIKGETYYVGGDVGEGNEDGDWSTACVVRGGTREQVGEYRAHILPRPFGDVLAAIGRYYNMAQIAPETNDMGRSTVDRLREIYTNIYIWRKRDTIVPTFSKLIGWETTHGSKILLVNLARELLHTRQVRIHSTVLWDEMANFIRDYTPTGLVTYRAATGHDDTVLSWMIALQIREDEDYSRFATSGTQDEKKIDAVDKAYYDAEGLNIAVKPDYLDEIRDWE